MLLMRLLCPSSYRSKQDAKPTGAEEGEVAVSGHVVLLGTDHRLGSSGFWFSPKWEFAAPWKQAASL